ncbi:MAG: DUF5615 family PIN-like protein [Planctomycetes bacterium]|nr:DUF5615 family PIN-like protein [Planctomycetota bacterium]
MKLKLDENLSHYLRPALEKGGHAVATVLEEGLRGRPDPEVGRAARDEGRMLLTLDLEFADLRKYAPGTHPGIILFRPRTMGPRFVNRLILEFVRDNDLADFVGCVVVVDPTRIRVRRPPLDASPGDWRDIPLSDA